MSVHQMKCSWRSERAPFFCAVRFLGDLARHDNDGALAKGKTIGRAHVLVQIRTVGMRKKRFLFLANNENAPYERLEIGGGRARL